MNRSLRWKLVLLIGLVASGAFLIFHYDLHIIFSSRARIIAFIDSFEAYSVPVFILIQILQVIVAPIPGELTGLVGGFLFGPYVGLVYSTVGLTVGSWLAFSLSRFFGMPFVERIVKPEVVRKYNYLIERKGALVSFVLFIIPGFPKDYFCYLLGLSGMRLWTFLVVSTVGRFFGTAMLSICGGCVRNDQFIPLVILSVISGLLLLAAYIYRDRWLGAVRARSEKTESEPGK